MSLLALEMRSFQLTMYTLEGFNLKPMYSLSYSLVFNGAKPLNDMSEYGLSCLLTIFESSYREAT